MATDTQIVEEMDRARIETTTAEKNARERLRAAKAFVFDMDGVLYRGDEALPGVNDVLNALTLRDKGYMLATNNSMATPADYVRKLAGMDIVVPEASILT